MKKMTLLAMYIAICVIGSSVVSIPIGVAKVAPIQHMMTIICTITLGPIPAIIQAILASLIRLMMGTGTLLAIPGSVIGAVLAGMLYRITKRRIAAISGEIIGTGIIASLVAVPYSMFFMHAPAVSALFFMPSFLLSTVTGAMLALAILKAVPTRYLAIQ